MFRTGDGSPAAQLSLGGMVRGGYVNELFVALVVEDAETGERRLVRVKRGEPPDGQTPELLSPKPLRAASAWRYAVPQVSPGLALSLPPSPLTFTPSPPSPTHLPLYPLAV